MDTVLTQYCVDVQGIIWPDSAMLLGPANHAHMAPGETIVYILPILRVF